MVDRPPPASFPVPSDEPARPPGEGDRGSAAAVPVLLTLDEAASRLRRGPSEVIALIFAGRLCGAQVGTGGAWMVGAQSIREYLAEQVETVRRMALWRQANEASFPELWGPIR